MANRLFAIGDIHGCNLAFRALIKAVDPSPEDTIVVLGDVIDWGPDSRDCVRQLIDLSGRCRVVPILGNHEELMLQALDSDSALRSWLDLGGDRTLLSYPYDGTNIIDPTHVEFIRGFLDYCETGHFIYSQARRSSSATRRRLTARCSTSATSSASTRTARVEAGSRAWMSGAEP